MPTIEISDSIYQRVAAFRPLVESVIESQIDLSTCIELILAQGMDRMLADLIGEDPAVLASSLQQLAAMHPGQVYPYVARMMEEGALVSEREALRRRVGFRTPEPQEPDK